MAPGTGSNFCALQFYGRADPTVELEAKAIATEQEAYEPEARMHGSITGTGPYKLCRGKSTGSS